MSAQTTAPIIPSPANLGAKIGTTYPTITRSTAAAMPGHSRSGRREAVSFMFIQIASAAVTRTLDESRRESSALDVERLRRVPPSLPLGATARQAPRRSCRSYGETRSASFGTGSPRSRRRHAARRSNRHRIVLSSRLTGLPFMMFSSASTRLLPVLAICLAASLPYVSSAGNYFVNDDFGVVQLLSQKPPLYFPRWFVTSWMDDIWGATQDEIRPFPAVTYQLAALWGATSTVANHVTNIAFHAANALLVLAIARAVAGLSFVASTFAALVFAILPLHAESVVWITGRVDTIPALFFLGSVPGVRTVAPGRGEIDAALPVLLCSSARSSANRTPSSWWRRCSSTISWPSDGRSAPRGRGWRLTFPLRC